MSNPARRRGRGGNTQPQPETSSTRSGAVAPGAYDGPASHGGASSNPSSGGRPPSNAPSATSPPSSAGRFPSNPPSATFPAGSAAASPGTSPRAAQQGSFAPASGPQSPGGEPATPLTDPARDPARQARLTDSLRNVDLPASFYNMDNLVRCLVEILFLSSPIILSFLFTCYAGGHHFRRLDSIYDTLNAANFQSYHNFVHHCILLFFKSFSMGDS